MTIAAGRKALITGGASGFGFDIGRRLHRSGAQVALLDIHSRRLEEASRELHGAVIVHADVRDPDQVARAVRESADTLKGLDTLVLAAGVVHIKPLQDVTEQDWDLTLDVNLKGAFLVAQTAAPYLAASGRGRIITISSDCGRRGFPWQQAYCASKFGLIGLTESLAAELAPSRTTVNCLCPVGCPTTGMGQQVLSWKVKQVGAAEGEIVAQTAASNPLGRNASELDVTEAALFFVSEEASFLTGVALDVDGGAHLGVLPGVGGPSSDGVSSAGVR